MSFIDSTPEIYRNGRAIASHLKFEESRDAIKLFELGTCVGRADGINCKAQAAELCVGADDVVDK